MIKLASFEEMDSTKAIYQQFMVRIGNMPNATIPAMAAMVGIKRAEDILDVWKSLVKPSANAEFRDIVKQQPGVKKWAAFGSELSRHSAVTYKYSAATQKKEEELKKIKEQERTNGTAIAVPGDSTQEFKIELVKPFVDTLPF